MNLVIITAIIDLILLGLVKLKFIPNHPVLEMVMMLMTMFVIMMMALYLFMGITIESFGTEQKDDKKQ